MRLPCFEKRSLLNDTKVLWNFVFSFFFSLFFFFFLKKNNGKIEQLDENNFRRCYGNFFLKVSFQKYLITAMFKVLFQQLRSTLTMAYERQLTFEDLTDMDQYRCQACTKTFNLLFCASLSLKQA